MVIEIFAESSISQQKKGRERKVFFSKGSAKVKLYLKERTEKHFFSLGSLTVNNTRAVLRIIFSIFLQ